MGFHLHRSDRADALVGALAAVLADVPPDPFTPEIVCVHSKGVERWLGHRLSAVLGATPGRADGISANLELPFPGALVGDALADATKVDRRSDPWRPERLVWPLLDTIDACITEPWMEILREHTGAGDPGSPKADRRFAAARHLADLFDRYATHRPEMVLGWLAGDDLDGAGRALEGDLAWQPRLWRSLRDAVDVASPAERLIAGCRAIEDDPGVVRLPTRLCVYGITRLPASYVRVLRSLAVHREVHLFALHPSPAMWEAVAAVEAGTDDERARAATALVSHPLLRTWGRDSREMQLVLADHAIAGGGAPPSTDDQPPPTLLARIQADLRADAAPTAAGPFRLDRHDRSVQVHACHGRSRQAEIVRDAITHLFEADPTLEPRDVVVLCPDIDEIAPLFHAAFGAVDAAAPESLQTGTPALPYRMADRSIRQTNPVLGAVAELLGLVDARLTATQVLTFAGLPPVRERFGFDDEDLERLTSWVSSTGIRWGLDADHRDPFGVRAIDTGTWRAGIQRLLLGVAMTEDDLRLVGGVLPLDDVGAGDIGLAGRFAELLDRLGIAVAALVGPKTLGAWTAALTSSADLLLHTRPLDAWQRAQLDRLLTEVTDQAAGSASTLRLAEVRDLLDVRLRGQPTRAAFRSGDITLCTLVPMRSVPHRVVCVVGLDDGAFPRGSRSDGDDILLRNRRLGDHDRPVEDRQLLLDAVLAAGDALVVTYAGRDERTNEARPAAVPVQELLDVVEATSPGAEIVRHHPLHATDPSAFDPAGNGPWSYDAADLRGARAAIGARRPIEPFLPGPLAPLRTDVIALEDLVALVGHPVRAFFRTRLGLGLGSWDDRPSDALGVEAGGLEAWKVGERVLASLLAGADLADAVEAERARGHLPPGMLGERVLAAVQAKAVGIATMARAVAIGPATSLEIDVALPDGRRIVGTVPGVHSARDGRPVVRTASTSTLKARTRIQAWVRFLASTAAHPHETLSSVTVGWHWGKATTVTFASLGGTAPGRNAAAVERLAVLVDLYDRGMVEPLPISCETSFALCLPGRAKRSPQDLARSEWESGYDWPKEDSDAEHVLLHAGKLAFDDLLAEPPRADEAGDGWPKATSRFEVLARRLFEPMIAEARTASLQDRADDGWRR